MRCFGKERLLNVMCLMLLLAIGATCAYSCAYYDGYLLDEATIIVWDKQSHTEHFIRRAGFEDIKGRSVGLIVPTPNVPQLAEADKDVLDDLDGMMRPEIETRKLQDISLSSWLAPSWKFPLIRTPEPLPAYDSAAAVPADAALPVEVLQHQRIGDLDAITVRATDTKALNRWLAKHDYSSSPESEKWLDVYVKKGWVVTAFRFAKGKHASSVSSPLIRMSFKIDQPFYPYREPQNKEAIGGRQLRIYLFANGRMQAAPGNFGKDKNWPGKVKWSDDLQSHPARLKSFDASLSKRLGLPKEVMQQAHWMTVFDDSATPRPGTDDITFVPTTDKSKLPDPIIKYKRTETKIPVEAVLLMIVALGIIIKARRGRSNSDEE